MRLLIADDHDLFRDGLRAVLEAHGHQVVAEAGDGAEAVAAALEHRPDVVLMDLRMPGIDGLQALQTLHDRAPEVPVVILTAVEDDEALAESIRHGARGYVLKSLQADRFLKMLEGVRRGEPALSPSVARKLLDSLSESGENASTDSGRLTAREAEIVELLAAGKTSNRLLAESLGISENTVKFHMRNILRKLHLSSRAQVVAYAVRSRLGPSNVRTPLGGRS
ncbi:MAG: response regulator transcription factor [Thermoanaerobaculia bacterium]